MSASIRLSDLEQSFLPNSQGLTKAYKNNNTRFPQLAAQYTREACQRLQQGEMTTCAALYDFLADKRAAIAKALQQENAEAFGVKRDAAINIVTPVANDPDNVYADQYPALLSGLLKNTATESKAVSVLKEFGIYQEYDKFPFETLQICHYYTTNIVIRMNDVPLTEIKIFQLSNRKVRDYMIYHHATSKSFPPLMERAEDIFRQLLAWDKKENDEPRYYALLGQLIWYLAQNTPLDRGSAATTDMFCKTLLCLHQYTCKPYKKGVNYDLRALSTFTAEAFARTFYHLFEGTPDVTDPFQVNDALLQAHRAVLPAEICHWKPEYNTHQNLYRITWGGGTQNNLLDSFVSHQFDTRVPCADRSPSARVCIREMGYAVYQGMTQNNRLKNNYLYTIKNSISLLKWQAFQNNHISYYALKDIFLRDTAGPRYYHQAKTYFRLPVFLEFINARTLIELEDMTEEHRVFEAKLCEQDALPPEKRAGVAWDRNRFFQEEKPTQTDRIKNLIHKIYARIPVDDEVAPFMTLYNSNQCMAIIEALESVLRYIQSPKTMALSAEDRMRIESAPSLFPSLKADFQDLKEFALLSENVLRY